MDWERKSWENGLSEDYIRNHKDQLNWVIISKNQKLSEPFIEEMKDKVNWYYLCQNQHLSEPFLRKWKNKFNLNDIFQFQKVSEEFIRETIFYLLDTNQDDFSFYWKYVITYQTISKDLIREVKEKFREFDLSANLICEHQDTIDLPFVEEMRWELVGTVTEFLSLNKEFIRRWKESLDWKNVCRHYLLSDKFIDEMAPFIDWDEFVLNQGVNDDDRFEDWFWEKYDKKIWEYKLHHTRDYYAEYRMWEAVEEGKVI